MLSSVVTLYLIHPMISLVCLNLFNCFEIEPGRSFLIRDMEIRCWGSDHVVYAIAIGLPMLCFWVIGLPAAALWILCKKRKVLWEKEQIKRYRVLYQGLREKTFYWEIVNVFRKLSLISVNVFFSGEDQMYKALVGVIIIQILLALQGHIKPYKFKIMNEIESREMIASVTHAKCLTLSDGYSLWWDHILTLGFLGALQDCSVSPHCFLHALLFHSMGPRTC